MAIAGQYFLGLADANKRLLNCFGYQNAPMIIQIIVAVFHIYTVYLTSINFEMGVYGPPIVISISNFL
jgi:Na+-driven multidrug efflux pump